jgi:tight adherence protein C
VSWLIGTGYVLAGLCLVAGLTGRVDPTVTRLLGSDRRRKRLRPRRPVGLPFSGLVRTVRERLHAKAERSDLVAEVPNLLDLLSVSVTAGLSPRLALERASELVAGSLGEVLEELRNDVALGAPWRVALETVGRRTGVDELRRLALTLDRAERLGSPIAERIRTLATEVRRERRTQREERARRAPVQMLFPLVFLILPAFVLSAVVPALLVATRGVI